MKASRVTFIVAIALAGLTGVTSALAQHRGGHRHHHHGYYGGPRVSIGFGFGVPFAAYPYYYYSPYYYPSYYPQPVVVQQPPPVYVEQNPQPVPSAQPSAPAGYWYFCAESRAYYPYVKECPSGWQRVAPQPG